MQLVSFGASRVGRHDTKRDRMLVFGSNCLAPFTVLSNAHVWLGTHMAMLAARGSVLNLSF
jgi:hypothetical protein